MRPGAPIVWAPVLLALLAASFIAASHANVTVFVWLNGWSRITGVMPWPFVTILGDTAVALALMTPLVIRRPEFARALAVSAIAATLFVHGLKPFFDIPRPPAVLLSGEMTVIGPRYTAHAFPSGHTTTAFVGAGLICLSFRSHGIRFAALLGALAVGISRAVVGVHWPLDILVGAAGGWACAGLGWFAVQRWGSAQNAAHRIVVVICLGCAIALLAGLKTGYPAAVQLQYAIGAAAIFSCCVATLSKLAATTFHRNPPS